MNQLIIAEIADNREIAKGIYRLVLTAPKVAETAAPGQFVNVYLRNSARLLPRPISICETRGKYLALVYGVVGDGTRELSSYEAGQKIRISNAGGNGFDMQRMQSYLEEAFMPQSTGGRLGRVLLAAGGIGVPPMAALAKTLQRNDKVKTIAVIGFKDEPFLVEELRGLCDEMFIATDNGACGFHGNILDLIKKIDLSFDYAFACGPKVMLSALCSYCAQKKGAAGSGTPIQISMEERMGCGYGACVGCVCKIRSGAAEGSDEKTILKKVCKDGPVFMGDEVVFDE